ncbi:MAG: hypothetical protein ACYSYL_07415 [Planctomycetota bacterium]
MHPRTLVSDVGHLKEVFIKAGFATSVAEKRFVSSGAARGYNYTIEVMLGN